VFETFLVVLLSAVNFVGGFLIGTWYCKNIKGMK
jgi:hypothetical protein